MSVQKRAPYKFVRSKEGERRLEIYRRTMLALNVFLQEALTPAEYDAVASLNRNMKSKKPFASMHTLWLWCEQERRRVYEE